MGVIVGRNAYGARVSPDIGEERCTFDPGATDQQVASSHYLYITVYYYRLLVLYP